MKRICLAVAVLMLAGCQTAPSRHNALPPPVAEPGAVPHNPSEPSRPPVESAGPLTKAAVGTYMDAQEADLRSYLHGQGVLVARRGDGLLVSIPNDRLFEHMQVSAWGAAVMSSVAQVLEHYDHSAVEIAAYTDATGSDQDNLGVSQKRAKIVLQSLVSEGVAQARLSASGLGASAPKFSDPRDPRNRRIELKITPTPSG